MATWTYQKEDRYYVAKQLNGNIISNFITTVYNYLHKNIRPLCDYFKTLGLSTARSIQLRTIGAIMGLPRYAVISAVQTINNIVFYSSSIDTVVSKEYTGYGDTYEQYPSLYGMFSETREGAYDNTALDDEVYRKILILLSEEEYNILGFSFLVKLLKLLLETTGFTLAFNTTYIDTIDITLSSQVSVFQEQRLSLILNAIYKYYIQFNIINEE